MNQTWCYGLSTTVILGTLGACADLANQGDAVEESSRNLSADESAALEDKPIGKGPGPEEIVLKGRRYIRHDLVSTEQWQIMSDPQNLVDVQGADADTSPTSQEATGEKTRDADKIRKLAIQLMDHAHNELDYYVEAEPNLELAERILYPGPNDASVDRPASDESAGEHLKELFPDAPSLQDKGIIGSDNRAVETCPGCAPGSYVGFYEAGGGGTVIAPQVVYTAAHVLYDNSTTPSAATGWKCADGSADTTLASPYTTPCNGPGEARAKWRFVTGLQTCGRTSHVTNIWISGTSGGVPLSSNGWLLAKEDYAVVDLACSPNVGYMGLIIQSYGITELFKAYTAGYPYLYPCPAGSTGEFSDCPSGTLQYTPGFRPYVSAVLYWTPLTNYFPGDQQSSRTWRGYMDIAEGQSGGPITDGAARILGVASNVDSFGGGNVNRFNRLDATVYNWMVAVSGL